MGKVEDRQSRILEILSTNEKSEVRSLADLCEVSLVTVRKDLTELEERGLLRREQGYAILNDENDMRRRLAANHSIKIRLAKEAAVLIEDGDTVMIESGSCCILLADEISHTKRNVTIITNSVFMADYIGMAPNIHLVLLGGDYQSDSQAVVGPITRLGVQSFHVKYFFAGTDGYYSHTGFTGDNHLRVETLRDMARNAEEVVILTESCKFTRQGIVPEFSLGEIQYLITDAGIPGDVEREIKEHGIQVIKTSVLTR
ncbi:DeoR/GlpR family DNA-binding transcription regulator [Muricomes intestini]|jgi:DeoR/GlpR family transcriptional regulator of sugar metabolism|uniref:DeoR/GlpR family DNA-binding transcription regulator n=2 Tax=Muricomes intestini TaxID=1796634 RepID=UPI002FD93CC2